MEGKITKKHSKKKVKQIKPIVLVPLIFGIVVALVLIVVLSMSKSNGPVYGNRCEGIVPIDTQTITSVENEISANEQVEKIAIDINCKTIEVGLTLTGELDTETVDAICKSVVGSLDTNVGYDKSNSESAYSDLFGVSHGVEQYDVTFIIQGEGELFPAFATKHVNHDAISYTFNTARDPELAQQLVDELNQEQQEEGAEEGE